MGNAESMTREYLKGGSVMNLEPTTLEANQLWKMDQTSNNLRFNPSQTSAIANYVTTVTTDTMAVCNIMKNNTIVFVEE